MAQIDRLIEKMVQRGANRLELTNDEPCRMFALGREATGPVISMAHLLEMAQEVIGPTDQLKQPTELELIHQTSHGKFAIAIEYHANILTVSVQPASQAQTSSQLCWFCKQREAVDGESLSHLMYRAPTGAVFLSGTIYYESLVLEVPRCAICARRHNYRNKWAKVCMVLFFITFGLALPLWIIVAFTGDLINYLLGTYWQWALVSYPGYKQAREEKFATGPSPRQKILTTFTWIDV